MYYLTEMLVKTYTHDETVIHFYNFSDLFCVGAVQGM